MKPLNQIRVAGLAVLLSLGTLAAVAQVYAPAPTPIINPTDLIPDNLNGNASVQSNFVNPTQISGTPGYVKAAPVTGFAFTFGNSQSYLLLNPAGTLAAGAATTAINPSDGQRECVRSTQAVTAFTFTPSPGQVINGAPTTLTAGTSTCITYSRNNATWDPS